MITLKERVCGALSGACARVIYGRPAAMRALPALCWRESQNRRHAQADGAEYLAELNYTLDIFAQSPAEAGGIAAKADERMRGAGFRRESAADFFESDAQICRVSLRYRALADTAGNVYQ